MSLGISRKSQNRDFRTLKEGTEPGTKDSLNSNFLIGDQRSSSSDFKLSYIDQLERLRLNAGQFEALRPHVKNKHIHDFGAGSLLQSEVLIDIGCSRVVAVDKEVLPESSHPAIVCRSSTYIKDLNETLNHAFLSWPINRYVEGLVTLLKSAETVIYIGKNTDGSACGSTDLFMHLGQREILLYMPDRRNTLIVYGPKQIKRRLKGEEIAAFSIDKIIRYEEVELNK